MFVLASCLVPSQNEEFRDVALRFLTQLRPSQLDGLRESVGINNFRCSLRMQGVAVACQA